MEQPLTNTILGLLRDESRPTEEQPNEPSPESPVSTNVSVVTDVTESSGSSSGNNPVKKRRRRRGGKGRKKASSPKSDAQTKSNSPNWRQKENEANHLPSRVLPVESEVCKSEQKYYKKNKDGEILYKGSVVCRFNMTSRGCRNGDKCKFLHKKLACAYHRVAAQGCIFPAEDCPFSHSDDAVMVSPPVRVCPNCKANHCFGSICLRCNTTKTKERKEHTKKLCRQQQQQLEKSKKIRFISNPPIEAKTLVFDERGEKWAQPVQPHFKADCYEFTTSQSDQVAPPPQHLPHMHPFYRGMYPPFPPMYCYGGGFGYVPNVQPTN